MQVVELDLSLKPSREEDYSVIHAKQGDVGRKFQVRIMDNGESFPIPTDAVFSVWYFGTSGEGNYTDIGDKSAFAVDGNCVTVELIAQMLTFDGGGSLSLIMNTADGRQIGLWNIPYAVEKIRGIDSAEAKQYYSAFSECVEKAVQSAMKAQEAAAKFNLLTVFPVGAIYMSVNSQSPALMFGGIWEPLHNRFLIGGGDIYAAGATGGEAAHILNLRELPNHTHLTYRIDNANLQAGGGNHVVYVGQDWSQGHIETLAEGNDEPHNNMPPYLAVYMWKRVA